MGIFNRILLILCTSLLGACALPVPVQMASWALDGVSMLTTRKSVTDHGISILAQKDCAIWRGVKGDDICQEGDDILTAFAEAISSADADPQVPPEPQTEVGELAAFEVAAGPVIDVKEIVSSPAVSLFEADSEAVVAVPAEEDATAVTPEPPPPAKPASASAGGNNIYYVIGSFTGPARAERLAARHALLDGKVMRGRKTNGDEVFRSVVGPFGSDQRESVQRQIIKAGISDAWETRVDHNRWFVYRPVETAMRTGDPPPADDGFDRLWREVGLF